MKLKQQRVLQASSQFIVATALISCCPLLSAQEPTSAELTNPQLRQALQKLINKYKVVEAQQKAASSVLLQATEEAVPNSKQNASQNSDASIENIESEEDQFADLGAQIEGSRFSEGEELILGLEISSRNGPQALADVFAYKTKTSAKVSFSALVQVLELPLDITLEPFSVKGWLFSEDNPLSGSVSKSGMLEVRGKDKVWQLKPSEYTVESDDIYIDLEYISQWLEFSYTIDESRLKLVISSQRQYPVTLRIARRNRTINTQDFSQNISSMPYRETPYQSFSPPLFDALISSSHANGTTSANYSLLGSHDFALFNTRYFATGSTYDELSDAQITFSRTSADGSLLGPLKATEVEFGDVANIGLFSAQNNGKNRGIRFSNTPLATSIDGQTVDLVGQLQNGWDVELYRNGILIGQLNNSSEGRYEFYDIPLDFGENIFEIVLYGPQGQIETKTETYTFDNNSVSSGQFNYQFFAAQNNKSVFSVEEDNFSNDVEQETGVQMALATAFGLTDWLGVNSTISRYKPESGEEQQSYGFGVGAKLGGSLLRLGVSELKDLNKEHTAQLSSRIFGQSVSARYNREESLSTTSLGGDGKREDYAFSMAGQQLLTPGIKLGYKNEWHHNDSEDETTDVFKNSMTLNTSVGSFGNNLVWRKQTEVDEFSIDDISALDPQINAQYIEQLLADLQNEREGQLTGELRLPTTTAGGFQYRNRFYGINTRLFTNYTLKPTREMTSYGVSVSYPIAEDISSNFNLYYYTRTNNVASNFSLGWRLDDVNLSATAGYNNTEGWSGGISARFGFGYSDDSGYFSTGRSITQGGAVSALVFEDKNKNGTLDSGEQPIKNAVVKTLQGGVVSSKTNTLGVAVLTGLTDNLRTDIAVDRASFDDPSMNSLLPGLAITGRKGYMEHINFPVTSTGELEGTLYGRKPDGTEEPLAYALIQLIDSSGNVVDTTQAEYDGYYLFVDIVPGTYRVMVDKRFTKQRNLRLSDPVYLAVKGGEVINGKDLFLNDKEKVVGFTVQMGSFQSLTLLKAYWSLLPKTGMNIAKLRPFYLQDEDSVKYVLSAGFFPEQHKADEVCNRIKGRNMACVVRKLETGL